MWLCVMCVYVCSSRLGVLFFLVVSQVFSSMGVVELFIRERAMFL